MGPGRGQSTGNGISDLAAGEMSEACMVGCVARMRILLQTWGTDGDIRPFIALGAGLVLRRHTVTLAVGSLDDKDYGGIGQAVWGSCIQAPEGRKRALRRSAAPA